MLRIIQHWRQVIVLLIVGSVAAMVLFATKRRDPRLLRTLVVSSNIRLADVTSDGRLLAFVGEIDTRSGTSSVSICRTSDGKSLRSEVRFPAYSVRFSPDGKLLAVAGNDGIRILTTDESKPLLRLEGEQVFAIAFSEDGSTMAVGSADGKIGLWDTTENKLSEVLEANARVLSLDFGSDKLIAIGTSAQTGVTLENEVPRSQVSILLWTAGQAKSMMSFPGHRTSITSLRFSPDKRFLVSGGPDGLVKFWRVGSDEPLWSFKLEKTFAELLNRSETSINDLAFSKNGQTIAVASDQKQILLLASSSGKVFAKLTGHNGSVLRVSFVNSHELMSVGEDGVVNIWNAFDLK